MKKISDVALQVLGRLSFNHVDGNTVATITDGQLDRKLYTEVNKVLEAVGGKWNRKLRGHLFPSDAAVEEALDSVLHTGAIVDTKKLFQFYETPAKLADELVRLADIKAGMRVLEPSAGYGALIRALARLDVSLSVDLYEVDTYKSERLIALRDTLWSTSTVGIRAMTFLDFRSCQAPPPSHRYDRVLMNPPFRNQQDAIHVRHAYNLLKPGGRLVAIMSAAVKFRETAHYAWVRANAETIKDNPPDAFKESGTLVRTCIVVMNKPE